MASKEATQVLADLTRGDAGSVSRLLPLVYEELRRLADSYLREERPDHTLQGTALVHEAFLHLVDQKDAKWQSRAHFYRVAAMAMRRILVNHARDRKRIKRGGGQPKLSLDDIDWRAGRILIRPGKSGRERHLPMPTDVGAALVVYLRQGRAKRPYRTLFLLACPPYTALTASGVSAVAKRVLARAGVKALRAGAHAFRHTAATQMVRGGVSFKQVADILGHARLETTAIYAKLDVDALATVALPWPGGA